MRPYVPALAKLYGPLEGLAWPIVRVATGALLMPHGWQKLTGDMAGVAANFAKAGLEPALLLAWYIALLEFVGGALLAAGVLTRLWAAQVVGFMAVATFHVHWGNGYFWTAKGYEYPLMWGLMALALVLRGGGRWSVDAMIGREP